MKYEIKRGKTVVLTKELQGKKIKQSPAVDYIDVTFSHPYAIQFKKNDVLTFKGQDYFLDETNNFITKNSNNNYDYKIRFQSRGYRATEIALLGYDINNNMTEVTFNINADLKTLAQLAIDNLNRVTSIFTENKYIKDSKENSALNKNNGNTEYKEDFEVSEFIVLEKNMYARFSYSKVFNELYRKPIICYYDENKNFLYSDEFLVDSEEFNVYEKLIKLNNNDSYKYFRISTFKLGSIYLYDGFKLGNVPNTDFEYLQVDRENVMSFLSKVSSTFNEPFYIEDNVISFGANLNYLNKEYAYGRGKGFKNITNKRQQNQKLITKLYATGSTENLPQNYGSDRLTIFPIFGSKASEYGIIEGFYNNDDIMPTTSGELGVQEDYDPAETITDFASFTFVTNLGFTTINEKAQINFTSGDFNGLSFNCSVYDYNGIEYITIKIKGHGAGEYVGLTPKEGDRFNITNIKQPPIVVERAEDKLYLEAKEYLDRINGMANEIDVVCDPLYKIEVNLNDVITVKDDELGIQGDYVVNGFTEDLQPLKDSTLQLSFNYTQLKNINLKLAKSKTSIEQVQIYDLQQQINEINKKI